MNFENPVLPSTTSVRPNDQHGVMTKLSRTFLIQGSLPPLKFYVSRWNREGKKDMLENPCGQDIQKRLRKNVDMQIASAGKELDEDKS